MAELLCTLKRKTTQLKKIMIEYLHNCTESTRWIRNRERDGGRIRDGIQEQSEKIRFR